MLTVFYIMTDANNEANYDKKKTVLISNANKQ